MFYTITHNKYIVKLNAFADFKANSCDSSPKGASRLTSLTKETLNKGAVLQKY
jgi:hypothetical protein